MKHNLFLWSLAAFVVALTSCTKQDIEELATDGSTQTLEVTAVGGADGRTVFGPSTDEGATYPVLWKKDATGRGEQLKVSMNLTFNASGKRVLLKDPSTTYNPRVKGEGATTSFRVGVADDGSKSYQFYAVCPGECWKEGDDNSSQPSLMRFEIPAVQSPVAPTNDHNGSCDPLAQLLVAKTDAVSKLPESLTMQFKHVAAYGLLSLTGLSEEDAPTLVRITSSQPIAGRFHYNVEDGSITRNGSGQEYHIALHVQSASSIWFAAAPTDLSNTSLWVTVVAANGNTWVKKIALEDNRKLKSGCIAKFSVALSAEDAVQAGSIYYEHGEPVGVVYRNTTTERRVVSAKRMAASKWATATTATGVSGRTDGAVNTAALRAKGLTIPMLDFCDEMGEGWYWPAYEEMQILCAAYHGVATASDINAKAGTSSAPGPKPAAADFPIAERKAQLAFDALLIAADGDAMNYADPSTSYGERYWSSSEHSTTTKALYMQFGAYQGSSATKTGYNYYGRAIKVIAKDATDIPTMTPDLRYATTREGVTVGSTSDRLLDLYLPAASNVAPAGGYPVFLFVHGGGFSGGDKYDSTKSDGGSNAKICMAMAERGFVAVSINYYLGLKHDNASGTSCTAEMAGGLPASGAFSEDMQNAIRKASEDAALALGWINTHASTYNLNTARVAVAGGSAGAITVLDLAYLAGQTTYPIQAVVDLWGSVANPSAIGANGAATPPALIYHGTKDALVNYAYSVAIAERLEALGVRVDFHTLDGRGHGDYTYIINNRMDEIAAFLNSL
nr:alpha/beta hydrolase [Rikenellaceae bacterium]